MSIYYFSELYQNEKSTQINFHQLNLQQKEGILYACFFFCWFFGKYIVMINLRNEAYRKTDRKGLTKFGLKALKIEEFNQLYLLRFKVRYFMWVSQISFIFKKEYIRKKIIIIT